MKPDVLYHDGNPISELEGKTGGTGQGTAELPSEAATKPNLAELEGKRGHTSQPTAELPTEAATNPFLAELAADPHGRSAELDGVVVHGPSRPMEDRWPGSSTLVASPAQEEINKQPDIAARSTPQSSAVDSELDAILRLEAQLQARKSALLGLQKESHG